MLKHALLGALFTLPCLSHAGAYGYGPSGPTVPVHILKGSAEDKAFWDYASLVLKTCRDERDAVSDCCSPNNTGKGCNLDKATLDAIAALQLAVQEKQQAEKNGVRQNADQENKLNQLVQDVEAGKRKACLAAQNVCRTTCGAKIDQVEKTACNHCSSSDLQTIADAPNLCVSGGGVPVVSVDGDPDKNNKSGNSGFGGYGHDPGGVKPGGDPYHTGDGGGYPTKDGGVYPGGNGDGFNQHQVPDRAETLDNPQLNPHQPGSMDSNDKKKPSPGDGLGESDQQKSRATNPMFPSASMGSPPAGSSSSGGGTAGATPGGNQEAPDLSSIGRRDVAARAAPNGEIAALGERGSGHFQSAASSSRANSSNTKSEAGPERTMASIQPASFGRGPAGGGSFGSGGSGLPGDNGGRAPGFQSNTASGLPRLNTSVSGGGGGGGGYQSGGPRPSPLARYLPKVSEPDANGVAGASAPVTQIQPRSVDIWGQVSQRFMYKCRIGHLYDCR
jgi:hypothetical protein